MVRVRRMTRGERALQVVETATEDAAEASAASVRPSVPLPAPLPGVSSLVQKVALVTGASRGIGAAITQELAAAGASVALVGRRRSMLQATLKSAGANVSGVALCCDLTADDQLDGLVPTVVERFGQLDVLVHCAGIISHAPIRITRIADFDAQFAANVRSPYRLTQACLPYLIDSQGQIVFVNSSIVRAAAGGRGIFAATQHALRSFADSLREEVNPAGVRVTSIFPGQTATPRQAALYAQAGKSYRPERLIQPRDIATVIVQALTLPRTAEITDIHIRPMATP